MINVDVRLKHSVLSGWNRQRTITDKWVHVDGTWYRELGAGMGATLNAASAMPAYTLCDRATWAAFANKGPLALLVEGDPALVNAYGVIAVDPARHPHVKVEAAQAFIAWLTSGEGQAAIGAFRIAGEPVFFPTARPD